jgi:VanZ family protein
VGEYAILGLLLLRAATLITNVKWSMPVLVLTIMTTSLIVAVTDELHQTFVASRGASISDIMIDTSGAFLGLLIGSMFRMNRPIRVEATQPNP